MKIKNPVYLIVLLALGLVFVSYKWVSTSCTSDKVAEEKVNSTISEIMARASVRAYSDREVSEEQLDTILKAAMAAPTAGNKQPWRFVVIRDPKTLAYIGDNFKSMTMVKNARVAIVVCGDVAATFEGEGRDYWIQDASAASENLLLAAHAMGLGAVWCGVYPLKERVDQFSEMLHLPADILPLNCIAIGYPSGETAPKDKWKPEYVHYNSWDGKEATLP
ncbi:MAG: nitroreductase family protein [Muribaculaceae bacterium]|nr:nitroreductase family protein [Muribaculaceae bacterium]